MGLALQEVVDFRFAGAVGNLHDFGNKVDGQHLHSLPRLLLVEEGDPSHHGLPQLLDKLLPHRIIQVDFVVA